jgi:hypothetical protein
MTTAQEFGAVTKVPIFFAITDISLGQSGGSLAAHNTLAGAHGHVDQIT